MYKTQKSPYEGDDVKVLETLTEGFLRIIICDSNTIRIFYHKLRRTRLALL